MAGRNPTALVLRIVLFIVAVPSGVILVLAGLRTSEAWRVVLLVVGGGVLLAGLAAWVRVLPRLLEPGVPVSEFEDSAGAQKRLEAGYKNLELQNNVRTALLQLFAGLFAGLSLLVGLWFTWHQTNDNLTVTRQGQIAERFGRAIDQLSGQPMETRLGGIYGPELIAEQDRSQRSLVAEVLVAYVRSHAPKMPASEMRRGQPIVDEELRDRFPDVQAALTVLSRRRLFTEFYQEGFSFNFAGLDLRRADLRGADLRSTNLNEAALNGADLRGADLRGVRLNDVELSEVKLNGANLRGLGLVKGDLHGVVGLSGVDLSGAKIIETGGLAGVDLHGAALRGAFVSEVDLSGANLNSADLRNAKFDSVHLNGADLRGTNLADRMNPHVADLRGSRANEETIWPEGFDWRSAGVLTD